jgi:hypothetical protein
VFSMRPVPRLYNPALTLKMELICFSETPVDFQRNALRYIPEDSTLRVVQVLVAPTPLSEYLRFRPAEVSRDSL